MSKLLTVLGVRGGGYSSILECREEGGYGTILVNPFVGCAVEVSEDISVKDYALVAEKMVGKKYLLTSSHIFEPEYLPNEGEFTEIKNCGNAKVKEEQ